MKDKRKVLVLSDDIEPVWLEIKFEELKTGDLFKLFEPTGEPVVTDDGRTEFLCTSDAFLGPYGPEKSTVWTVETDVP